MKRIFIALFTIAAFCISSMAQQSRAWEGYLADMMCGSKWTGEKGEQRAMKHTKACGLEEGCRASGYGMFTGGKFVKFTDASDAQAAEYLEKTTQESNIYVRVTGTMEGEKIAVAGIEKATKASVKGTMKEKMEKKGKGMHGGTAAASCACCNDGDQAKKQGAKGTKGSECTGECKEGEHAKKHGKEHECTGDCKDGTHTMKHGEKGHVCGEDCMKKS